MTTTISLQANAQTCDDYKEGLSKCDKALNAQIEVNNLQRKLIDDQQRRFEVTQNELDKANDELGKWYHDGVKVGALTLSVGLILGLTAGYLHGR